MSMQMSGEGSQGSPLKLSTEEGGQDDGYAQGGLSVHDQKGDEQSQPQYLDDAEYKETKDRYVGQIDPVSKLRQGNGCYTFTNPFFQYQGNYDNGKKNGKSFETCLDELYLMSYSSR